MSEQPVYLVPANEVKRIQDHAFSLALSVQAARRMLQALDHYWASYERDPRWEYAWWSAFEKWRGNFEARANDSERAS